METALGRPVGPQCQMSRSNSALTRALGSRWGLILFSNAIGGRIVRPRDSGHPVKRQLFVQVVLKRKLASFNDPSLSLKMQVAQCYPEESVRHNKHWNVLINIDSLLDQRKHRAERSPTSCPLRHSGCHSVQLRKHWVCDALPTSQGSLTMPNNRSEGRLQLSRGPRSAQYAKTSP